MKVIEQFVQSKTGNPETGEDGIFVNEHFIAIVDGATAKSDTLWNGKKSGKIATDLILSALSKISSDSSAQDTMLFLNESIATWYKEKNIYDHMRVTTVDRCTAGGIAVFSKAKREVWLVGDCQALIDEKKITNEKLVDHMNNIVRAFYLESELAQGKTIADLIAHDTGRDFIQTLIRRQTLLQNASNGNEFAYTCLDGFFTDTSTIKVISVPDTAKTVVLASDGYPEIYVTLEQTENALASLLKEDPLLFRKYKSTKGLVNGNVSYDDRAYVRFVVNG